MWLAGLLAACGSPGSDAGVPSADSAGVQRLSASCGSTPNVLRYTCEIDVEPAQAVQLSFWPTSDPDDVQVFTSLSSQSRHDLGLYLMRAGREYAWEAQATRGGPVVQGSWVTGELPAALEERYDVSGTPTMGHVMFMSPCQPYAIVADVHGETLWYQRMDDDTGVFRWGVVWTEDDTVLTMFGRRESEDPNMILEFDMMGNEVQRIVRGEHFDEYVHHDMFRRDGLTYALRKDLLDVDGETFVYDGIYVFDGTQLVADWELASAFTPEPGATQNDYTHGNSLFVDGEGNMLVSFRHLSSIALLDGDTSSSAFGDWIWGIQGLPSDSDVSFPNDFPLVASVDGVAQFSQQHNAHMLDDGSIVLFDNSQGSRDSRVVRLRLDPSAKESEIIDAYSMEQFCSFDGGAWTTAEGNPVGTCAPARRAVEFDAASGEALWEMTVSCDEVVPIRMSRVIPWARPNQDPVRK